MFLSYLTQIPFEVLLCQGGFGNDKDSYLLHRSSAIVPTELRTSAFLWVDAALATVTKKNTSATDKERDISAQKFVELLVGPLRVALWQDLACLQAAYSEHAFFSSSFFMGVDANYSQQWATF